MYLKNFWTFSFAVENRKIREIRFKFRFQSLNPVSVDPNLKLLDCVYNYKIDKIMFWNL